MIASVDPGSTAGGATEKSDRLTLFVFLWALAVLFHQASYAEWSEGALDLGLTALATLVVLRPTWLPAFVALLSTQLADVLYELPWVSNHWLFAGCAAATMLAGLTGLRAKQPRGRLDRGKIYESFAPWLRMQLLVLYAFAVLHKLNSDFLDPERSCAVVHSTALVDGLGLPIPIETMSRLMIAGTLVVEALIPVLLCFRRTATAGILLGVVFHGAIGLNIGVSPFYNFSSLLFACYALFLPNGFSAILNRRMLALRDRGWLPSLRLLGAMRRLLAVTLVLLVVYGIVRGSAWNPDAAAVRSLWSLFAASFGILVVMGWADRGAGHTALWGRPRVMAVFPALLVLNGMCPYIGLKTETSFAMFSNLRTEGGLDNHLFLSGLPRVAAFQDELVELIDSSDPRLSRVARSPLRFVFFELHAYLHRMPETRVRYRRAGRVIDIPRVADDPILSEPVNALERKLLAFRVVDPRGGCRH